MVIQKTLKQLKLNRGLRLEEKLRRAKTAVPEGVIVTTRGIRKPNKTKLERLKSQQRQDLTY